MNFTASAALDTTLSDDMGNVASGIAGKMTARSYRSFHLNKMSTGDGHEIWKECDDIIASRRDNICSAKESARPDRGNAADNASIRPSCTATVTCRIPFGLECKHNESMAWPAEQNDVSATKCCEEQHLSETARHSAHTSPDIETVWGLGHGKSSPVGMQPICVSFVPWQAVCEIHGACLGDCDGDQTCRNHHALLLPVPRPLAAS